MRYIQNPSFPRRFLLMSVYRTNHSRPLSHSRSLSEVEGGTLSISPTDKTKRTPKAWHVFSTPLIGK